MYNLKSNPYSDDFLRRQADRTKNHRMSFYRHVGLANMNRVLEVGCGMGLVLSEIKLRTSAECHGIDINEDAIRRAQGLENSLILKAGTGEHLPYRDCYFNLVFTHFALLWQKKPLLALKEMYRVTCRGGWVAALAEPDYGGFITDLSDKEAEIEEQKLLKLGAQTRIGRKLPGWFNDLGLKEIQAGVLNANLETMKADTLTPMASSIGYLPIFWAWGKKPD
jgi:ubiquinone/menaquinone biosynthesis C-methylase UbiE